MSHTFAATELELLEQCPVCRGEHFDPLYDACRDLVFGNIDGEWRVFRCTSCGTSLLNPRPIPTAIGKAYTQYFTHQPGQAAGSSKAGVKLYILQRIRGSYINAHYGKSSTSLGRLGLNLASRLPQLTGTLDRTYRYLPYPKQGPRRLLDIGCGNGDFLMEARAVGWEVYGCDLDTIAASVAKRATQSIRVGGSDAWSDKSGFFQAISMNHVIEHLHNPLEALAHCRDMLADDGCLHIETPNLDALGHEIYGRYWESLDVPRHLSIFTWKSLEHALNQTGFTVHQRMQRNNFEKSCRASAILEAGNQHQGELRLPSPTQTQRAKEDSKRSEVICVLARKK